MAETWVIKSDAAGELVTTQISFTSNGQKFTSIGANYNDSGTFMILRYDNNEVAGWDIYGGGAGFEFDNLPKAHLRHPSHRCPAYVAPSQCHPASSGVSHHGNRPD